MPSFDVVSEVNKHEVTNAVQQTQKLAQQRFDLKELDILLSCDDQSITLESKESFGVDQGRVILLERLAKRGIDMKALDIGQLTSTSNRSKQVFSLKQGLDSALAKKITGAIRDSKIKVQTTIQGDQVRVQGKKRDDLQAVIQLLEKWDAGQPLQFSNFRDN